VQSWNDDVEALRRLAADDLGEIGLKDVDARGLKKGFN